MEIDKTLKVTGRLRIEGVKVKVVKIGRGPLGKYVDIEVINDDGTPSVSRLIVGDCIQMNINVKVEE
jgi:hypothetical protein